MMKSQAAAVAVLLIAANAWAAHPVRVEDIHRLTRVGEARLSPDGKWVAFTAARSDIPKNKFVTNIWMVPAAGGPPQQMTFAESGSNASPRWSPDSRFLYFLSARVDDKTQVFRLAITGGEG